MSGLRAIGAQVSDIPLAQPTSKDVLIIWNRYGRYAEAASRYDAAGAPVIVAENGYLGRDWRGEHWYALSLSQHNGAGRWFPAGPERWDSLNADVAPWRSGGSEVVVLATRHIGPPHIAEPRGWAQDVLRTLQKNPIRGVTHRVRPHPGENPAVPLLDDLKNAAAVVTWGSGAGIKCLLAGIPVWYGFPDWIGAYAGAATLFARYPVMDQMDRAPMFQRLAWAMWRTDEIATGAPILRLLAGGR